MIKGRYVIDDLEFDNVLTSNAKSAILSFLAKLEPDWGGAIVVGTDGTAATSGDTELSFELYRATVNARAIDIANSEVVLKATMPTNLIGKIYEAGVYSLQSNDALQTGYLILDFDKNRLYVSNTTANTDNSRIGDAASQATVTASTTTTANVTGFSANFSENDYQDLFKLAVNILDDNCDSIEVRFKNTTGDYYTTTHTPSASGYSVFSWTRLDMTPSGSIAWSDDIVSMDFLITAGSGGDTDVVLDGLRLTGTGDDATTVLISRAVLPTPKIKEGIEEMDVEYRVQINI